MTTLYYSRYCEHCAVLAVPAGCPTVCVDDVSPSSLPVEIDRVPALFDARTRTTLTDEALFEHFQPPASQLPEPVEPAPQGSAVMAAAEFEDAAAPLDTGADLKVELPDMSAIMRARDAALVDCVPPRRGGMPPQTV